MTSTYLAVVSNHSCSADISLHAKDRVYKKGLKLLKYIANNTAKIFRVTLPNIKLYMQSGEVGEASVF